MCAIIFENYQPTEPIEYNQNINIFTGRPFPELLQGVRDELHKSFKDPKQAHRELFHRLWRFVIEENGMLDIEETKDKRDRMPHMWRSVWGFTPYHTHITDRRDDGTVHYDVIFGHESKPKEPGRHFRESGALRLIHEVQAMNTVPRRRKLPMGTKADIRAALISHGVDVKYKTLNTTRAKLLEKWREW